MAAGNDAGLGEKREQQRRRQRSRDAVGEHGLDEDWAGAATERRTALMLFGTEDSSRRRVKDGSTAWA